MCVCGHYGVNVLKTYIIAKLIAVFLANISIPATKADRIKIKGLHSSIACFQVKPTELHF